MFRRPARLADTPGLADFLHSRAAFVAQKSTVEYCRARAGLNWSKLFKEQAFHRALTVCRWEAYAAVLGDLVVVSEGLLRPHAAGNEVLLAGRLAALHRGILTGPGRPPHRSDGWSQLTAEFPARLAAAQLAAPLPADRLAAEVGLTVFHTLPIHKSLRGHDREMVVNSVRFGIIGVVAEIRQRVDLPAVAAGLLSATPPPQPLEPLEPFRDSPAAPQS